MTFIQKYFQENELVIKDKYFKYYLSPILVKNNSFGYQFISIQSTPFVQEFAGFWILKDIELIS